MDMGQSPTLSRSSPPPFLCASARASAPPSPLRLLLTSLELACHVAFLVADAVLLLSPVHEFYTPGQFQLYEH